MQSGLRWSGHVSCRRYPVAGAPYAPATVALVLCWHLVFSQALRAGVFVSGLRPGILCVPPPAHRASLLRSIGPVRRSARLPPTGAPSVRRRQGRGQRVQGCRRFAPALKLGLCCKSQRCG
jgi:hypothetical protein